MADLILADSSVWVQHFRGVPAVVERMRAASRASRLVICDPVIMEVLAGTRAAHSSRLEQGIDAVPRLDLDPEVDFKVAADLYRLVRESGRTVRSMIDALIAAVALRHPDVVLVHDDTDFDRIAAVAPLRHERWSRDG